ncbi:MAG: coenzyme F(420) biosynthesis enzyme [Selenomonadaceae bacterium]
MKKLMQMLLVACLMITGVQVAAASSDKTTIEKDFSLATIHRLAVADPQYTPLKDGAKKEEITAMIYAVGQEKAKMQIIPGEVIAANILRDAKVDINTLDKKQADALFKANVGTYADAYLVPTVVHNDRVVIFFDIYAASTNKLVYTYQVVADRTEGDNLVTYERLTRDFYRSYGKSLQKQLKDSDKAE